MTAQLTVVPGPPYVRANTQPISIEIKIVPGLFVKSMLCPDAGTIVPTHSHSFDHLSMLAAGRVMVWADSECLGVFDAPAGIPIHAGVKHLFKTLTPGTLIYCVHRTDENGEIPITDEHHLLFGETE